MLKMLKLNLILVNTKLGTDKEEWLFPRDRYNETNYVRLVLNAKIVSNNQEPTTFEEIMSCLKARSWLEVMIEEISNY